MNIERFKQNLEILKQHNITHIPVYHLTDGQTHEVDLINEIIKDSEELLKNTEKGMKIDLDIPVNIGDSIFFFDEARPEAEVADITVSFESGREKPIIIIGWAQYDVGPDVTELWDEGEVNLEDLGTTFWLTYEDMVRANRKKLTEYQLITDQALRNTYGEEIKECDISKRIGCEGCEHSNICQYQNKRI